MKWLYFLVACSLFSTETISIKREDGSAIIAYFDKPAKASFPILLSIAGSQKQTSLHYQESLRKMVLEKGLCHIVLEKRGCEKEKIDEEAFTAYLCLDDRLKDHLCFFEHLKTFIPDWNGKIAILGQGDGGKIGAQLASHLKDVKAIALIATGGGWDPLNEILYSFRTEMAEEHYSPQYIQGFMVQAKEVFAKALAKPSKDDKAFGYTYKYWESFLKAHLARDLSKLKCPIYSINGDLDTRVPIESVCQLSKILDDRVVLSRKNGGREILQDPKIYEEALFWLCEKL